MKFGVTRMDERHCSFVFSEVRRAAHKFPYALPGVAQHVVETMLLGLTKRSIVGNPRGAVIAYDEESPDTFYGFAISPGPARLTFCYTKYALRHMGICSGLIDTLSIDLSTPTSVQIWSPAASRMAAKGYRIYPEVIEPNPNEREHGREKSNESE